MALFDVEVQSATPPEDIISFAVAPGTRLLLAHVCP
jgi:hypothetical protein